MTHMTTTWLVKYANVNKMSSYNDKLASLLDEKNPYYILEWLLFSLSDDEHERIKFSRSPSMLKSHYIDFSEVFFTQIVYHMAFKAYSSSRHDLLILRTAISDLRALYGNKAWNEAVRDWDASLQQTWEKLKQFRHELKLEQERLMKKYDAKVAEIKSQFPDHSEEQNMQLYDARQLHEQRMKDVPQQLLMEDFKAWPLVAYIHYSQIDNPEEQLSWLKDEFMSTDEHILHTYIKTNDFAQLLAHIDQDAMLKKQFMRWYPVYASHTIMNSEHVDTGPRQAWWLNLLDYMSKQHMTDENELWEVTYDIAGIHSTMMSNGVIPDYLHHLIDIALRKNRRITWLKEAVILRYMDVFIHSFVQIDYNFAQLNWVLCLDPSSLEERLLRALRRQKGAAVGHVDTAFIIERLSDIYIDAIRKGLDPNKMIPMFRHLTIHHIDFMYGYIHNIKEAEEFFPLLQMEPPLMQRIFGGKGIRATEARKSLQPVYLAWLKRMEQTNENVARLRRWSHIFYTEKAQLVQQWLDQYEPRQWPKEQAKLFADCLQIEWIGMPSDARQEQLQVKQWLVEQSDWMRFETDVHFANEAGVTYTIIRPGFRDVLSFQLLARAVVRAELTDRGQIATILDDLKDL